MTTIIGYGSLLSEDSARQSASSLRNFRLVRVKNFKRIFNKVGIVFFKKCIHDHDGLYISSCATRADPACEIICSAFECDDSDLLEIFEREHRFWWVNAQFVELRSGIVSSGRMCTEFNDNDYLINKCISESEYYARVGKYYKGKIWRSDILPNKIYLAHCLMAAKSHGQEVYDNFLDASFLSDGETTMRQYLEQNKGAVSENADYRYAVRGSEA